MVVSLSESRRFEMIIASIVQDGTMMASVVAAVSAVAGRKKWVTRGQHEVVVGVVVCVGADGGREKEKEKRICWHR